MLRCAGPIPHHRLPATNGTRGLRGPGFIPAVADCRYRAPLSPRLVRPCPTPTGIRQTLDSMIQHFPGRCKNFPVKNLPPPEKKALHFWKFWYTNVLFRAHGPVAQLGERSVRIREVKGSSPSRSTTLRRRLWISHSGAKSWDTPVNNRGVPLF